MMRKTKADSLAGLVNMAARLHPAPAPKGWPSPTVTFRATPDCAPRSIQTIPPISAATPTATSYRRSPTHATRITSRAQLRREVHRQGKHARRDRDARHGVRGGL